MNTYNEFVEIRESYNTTLIIKRGFCHFTRFKHIILVIFMTADRNTICNIIKNSLWSGKIDEIDITEDIKEELRKQAIDGLALAIIPGNLTEKYIRAAKFAQMLSVQQEAINCIEKADIPVVVIKGIAVGIYYPNPYLRRYGDIDLLVHPDNYYAAIEALNNNEFSQSEQLGAEVTSFRKRGFKIELHQKPPGLGRIKEGEFIHAFLLSGLDIIEFVSTDQPKITFPMLPWKQNGLELIWHIREHLYNGLGLRQIIDWMMFTNRHLCSEDSFKEYNEILQKAGLEKLALIVTRMCQLYLGLDENIRWCENVDNNLCEELMEFILNQGDFGIKRQDDKIVKALTRYRNPFSFISALQRKGMREWKTKEKSILFYPFAGANVAFRGVKKYANYDGRNQLSADIEEYKRRKDLFNQLYNGEYEGRLIFSNNDLQPLIMKRHRPRMTYKQELRKIYDFIKDTPFRLPLYYLQYAYFKCRYFLYGKPSISEDDIKNVEKNVTFIYKSFNRRKQAERLYWCIKQYYPKARVIIADDSNLPLHIENIANKDVIIHLPFNSGLSRGLNEALKLVDTAYVMRMDDDELLTPNTSIHRHLIYLQLHPEVDLVGIQAKHDNPRRAAEKMRLIRMNHKLIIPFGTIIDGKEVVYKTPNVYLARTKSLRIVGFDPNIRMIDHHEFFYRAAGKIVCVQDSDAYVMHCHNRFENPKEYGKYRSDIKADYVYIRKKHGANYK